MQRKHLIVAIAAGLGLAGAIAFAANRGAIAPYNLIGRNGIKF